MIANSRAAPEIVNWVAGLRDAGTRILIPEIADFEIRRELIRIASHQSITRLNWLRETYDYEPISTAIMQRAAEFWALSRNRGRPLADPHALDGDCILAATAEAVAVRGHHVTIATTNIGHLALLTRAALWSEINS